VFQAARPVSGPGPGAFPWKENNHGQGGWVVLNMMISPQGKAYEVSVLESSGSPGFEAAAVKAMDLVKFQPATSGGAPIDSSLTLKYLFYQLESRGVSSSFQSRKISLQMANFIRAKVPVNGF